MNRLDDLDDEDDSFDGEGVISHDAMERVLAYAESPHKITMLTAPDDTVDSAGIRELRETIKMLTHIELDQGSKAEIFHPFVILLNRVIALRAGGGAASTPEQSIMDAYTSVVGIKTKEMAIETISLLFKNPVFVKAFADNFFMLPTKDRHKNVTSLMSIAHDAGNLELFLKTIMNVISHELLIAIHPILPGATDIPAVSKFLQGSSGFAEAICSLFTQYSEPKKAADAIIKSLSTNRYKLPFLELVLGYFKEINESIADPVVQSNLQYILDYFEKQAALDLALYELWNDIVSGQGIFTRYREIYACKSPRNFKTVLKRFMEDTHFTPDQKLGLIGLLKVQWPPEHLDRIPEYLPTA